MIGLEWHRIAVSVATTVVVRFLLPVAIEAQIPCGHGTAATTIDSGNAVATIPNNGLLFWAPDTALPNFEIPKGSGINVIFKAKPWIGGMMDDEFHFTGYPSGLQYYPGPLNANGLGVSNCDFFNRIWKVSESDLTALEQSGVETQDITDWPWKQYAPVVDGDGNEGNYDPESGDRPAIVGRESAWWIMNDGGRADNPDPPFKQVGLEARVLAAAMPSKPDVEVYYFRYTFRYANTSPLEDAYVAFYVDPDLGDFDTDVFASDSSRSTVIVYKRDNYDEKYGDNPPALGVTLLGGPLVDSDGQDNDGDGSTDEPNERLPLTAFIGSDDVHDGRTSYYYYHLQGLCGFTSGGPIREGTGCGYGMGQLTSFWYSGDPVAATGWLDDREPYDKAFLISSGPFNWLPGQEQTVDFAVIWARGTDNLDSLSRVRTIADFLLDTPEFFAVNVPADPAKGAPSDYALKPAYPNPFNTSTTISYTLTRPAEARIEVIDLLGKRVRVLETGFKPSGEHELTLDATGLPSGVYFYRITIGRMSATKPFMVVH